jgi:hypothetical protein
MVSLEFFIDVILHYGPGVDSASNRNEYQEYFLGGKRGWCVGLTTLPHSCADCLEIWEPQPPGTLWACNGTAFYLLPNDISNKSVGENEICVYVTRPSFARPSFFFVKSIIREE